MIGQNFTEDNTGGYVRYVEGSMGTLACRDEDKLLLGEAQTLCLKNGSWADVGHVKCGKKIRALHCYSSLNVTLQR